MNELLSQGQTVAEDTGEGLGRGGGGLGKMSIVESQGS